MEFIRRTFGEDTVLAGRRQEGDREKGDDEGGDGFFHQALPFADVRQKTPYIFRRGADFGHIGRIAILSPVGSLAMGV